TSRCSRRGRHSGFARFEAIATGPAAERGRSAARDSRWRNGGPTWAKTQVGVASGINLTSGGMNMGSLIGEWVGKVVSVALRLGGGFTSSGAAMLEGKLVQVGEAGVM